ncbi:hypothetical protein QBC46DRAFT_408631 [Diplogelasinospora grovesii]|uniref:Uncharacterized protein n=1 Tax=Diplogelasinospora grovesii TaxID=303347 RepID=A0AAN6N8F6_9PEZI|nr:hypothetical protein QBC46DRAFT_408631 [Diplogelasinospora grovesii]
MFPGLDCPPVLPPSALRFVLRERTRLFMPCDDDNGQAQTQPSQRRGGGVGPAHGLGEKGSYNAVSLMAVGRTSILSQTKENHPFAGRNLSAPNLSSGEACTRDSTLLARKARLNPQPCATANQDAGTRSKPIPSGPTIYEERPFQNWGCLSSVTQHVPKENVRMPEESGRGGRESDCSSEAVLATTSPSCIKTDQEQAESSVWWCIQTGPTPCSRHSRPMGCFKRSSLLETLQRRKASHGLSPRATALGIPAVETADDVEHGTSNTVLR